MCDLCNSNPDVANKARNTAKFQADQLERMASFYRAMASGSIKPHSEKAEQAGTLARALVRDLVTEWV